MEHAGGHAKLRIQRIKRGANCDYAEILGKDEKEIYREAIRKAAEKFSNGSAAYRSIAHGINTKNVTGAQYFWVNHLNSCLPKNQKIISFENPLRISGLEFVKDENPKNADGLLLKMGGNTKISTDKRFSASGTGREIPFGEKSKKIWTRKNSLSAICLGGGGYLYTDGGFDLYADCVCRVVVFGDECSSKPCRRETPGMA